MDKPNLEWAIRTLRQPAGPAREYANPEAIEEHQEDFIRAFHSSLKELHAEAIRTILVMETMLRKTPPDPSAATVNDYIQIWRRVNDTIVWIILSGQRHVIKTLCHFKRRGPLANHGLSAVAHAMDELNANPYGIAICTDATSCVDIGDIVHVDKMVGRTSLIEVKSGHVNEQIISSEMFGINDFIARYGQHGAEQVARYARQRKRMLQTLGVLNQDEGIDVLSGQPIRLVDCQVPDEDYDTELRDLLAEARSKEDVLGSVDGCLWIYATRNTGQSRESIRKRFRDKVLAMAQGPISDWLRKDLSSPAAEPTFSLQDTLYYPFAIPIFLRGIEDDDTLDIIGGRSLVLMMFDWGRFQKLVRHTGAELRWSSSKAGRRAKSTSRYLRPLIIRGLVPQIYSENQSFDVGAPQFFRILYDGLRPSCWARQLSELP